MSGCCGPGIPGCERVFDERTAAGDVRRLRSKGPPWATAALVDALASGIDISGATVLDIGAGVGAVHLALLERGAATAVDVDGSSAYLAVATTEAERRGLGDRVRHELGDVAAIAGSLEPADLVALDRVVCCYAHVATLLGTASALARRRIGLVYPRDTWWARLGVALSNPLLFRGMGGYRMHIHPVAVVAGLLGDAGFVPREVRLGRVWRVECWERPTA